MRAVTAAVRLRLIASKMLSKLLIAQQKQRTLQKQDKSAAEHKNLSLCMSEGLSSYRST